MSTETTAVIDGERVEEIQQTEGFLPSPTASVGAASTPRKTMAAWALSLVVVGGAGYAIGHSSSSTSAATPSALTQTQGGPGGTTTQGQGQGQLGGPGGGNFTPPTSGTITAISASSITVQTSAGASQTFAITSSTAVMNDGAQASASDLAVGDTVVVITGTPGSTTTSSSTSATQILAGTSATQGFGGPGGQGGFGAPGQQAQQQSTTTGTQTSQSI